RHRPTAPVTREAATSRQLAARSERREPLKKSMYRSFEPQRLRMRGDGEEAYPGRSVTEPATTQTPPLWPNPLGNGIFGVPRCCSLGHRLHEYAPSAASRVTPKMLVAIGAA